MKTLTKITYSQATLILTPTQDIFKFTMKFSRLHGLGAFLARIYFSRSVFLFIFTCFKFTFRLYYLFVHFNFYIYFSLFHFFLYLFIFFSYFFFFLLFYLSLFLLFSYFSNIPSSFFQSCISISFPSFSSSDTFYMLIPFYCLIASYYYPLHYFEYPPPSIIS